MILKTRQLQQHFITINKMNQPPPRHTLNTFNVKNVESIEGLDSLQSPRLAGLGEPKKSLIIVTEGPLDSKSQKGSSKHQKQSPEEAALVNSQFIHLPIQGSQIQVQNGFPPLLQPITHSQLQNPKNPAYINNNVVHFTSIALRQLAKTVSQPLHHPPLPPNNIQKNLQGVQTTQNSQQSLHKIHNQNRLSPPSRPSSSVPTIVHFNYQQTQKQPAPPQQIQIITYPTQNIQPVIVSPQPPQYPQPGQPPQYPQPAQPPQPPQYPPKIIDNQTQQLINQNYQLREQMVCWQQRYFTVIERFQFCYERIEKITQQYIIIQEQVQKCSDPEELNALKQTMASLQQTISQTEQELVEAVNRNKQVVGDTTNWKAKYQELVKMHSNQKSPQLLNQLQGLESHLSEVESNYKRVLGLNQLAQQKERKYIQEINLLNQILSQKGDHNYQDEHKKYSELLVMKEDQINTLRMIVQAQKSDLNNPPSQQFQTLIHRLDQQKNEIYNTLKQTQQELNATKKTHEQRIAQYEYQLKVTTQQIKRYQLIIEQRGRGESTQISPTVSNNQISHDKDLEILRLKHQLNIKQETQSTERKVFNSKIHELTSVKDSTIAILQEKTNILESDLNKKDSLIRSLRDRIYELEETLRIKSLDDKYQKGSGGITINAVKSSGIHSGESHQNDKQLHNIRTKLKQQNLKFEQAKGQVSEYKRLSLQSQDALTAVKHQNAVLKKQIDDLNYKLNQVKETVIELEQGLKTYNELKVYSEGLKEALHQKEKEILMLHHRIEDLELMQKQTTKIKPPQLAQLAQFTQITEQNQMLQASIYKKDLQLSKLKQNNQLLQNTYDQLQGEYHKMSQKKMQNQKQLQNEKNELKNKISMLQTKSLDYERKLVGLEEVRSILQQQLSALTSELQVKIENLQRSEIELKQEKAKNKTFENEIESKMSEGEELKIKLKEFEKKNNNLLKEVQIELDKKNDEINNKKSEVLSLQSKVFDLQSTLKTRQAKLKQLQKSNENLKAKMVNVDSNLEELKYLKQKITEYESKVSALTYKTASRLPNTEPTQIFERKVIYQLKVENQALKQQLNLINRPTNDSNNNEQLPKKELKERLTDFNQRLEEVIGEHFNGDLTPNGHNDLFKKYQRDRRQLIQKYNEQITQLKLKILELQSQHPSDHRATYSKGHNSTQSIYSQQIQFYRQKNTELQERVDSHIKVNKDLKEQIERLIQGNHDEYSINYYSQQLEKSNELNTTLQQKIKKANLQIKRLREQLSKTNFKPIDNSQFEIRISQLNRKISQFVLEINELQRQKAELNQLANSLQQDLQKSKAVQEEVRLSREDIIRQLQQKNQQMQNQNIKLSSRIKLLQAEIERINDANLKRQNNQSAELNNAKNKLNDSIEENRKLKAKMEEYLLVQERNQREITKYQTQYQSTQLEIQRYREQAEAANRKCKETETEIYNLRSSISDYEGKLRSKESMFDDHNYLQSQLNQQISRLKSQCALLSQEIQRVNEFSQKRISEKETELNRLRLTVSQKQQTIFSLEEQISQFKINLMKSNQTNQQLGSLQEEINRLNYTLIVRNNDYERRGQEINDLNARIKLSEEQIKELRKTAQAKTAQFTAIISRLQMQLKASIEKEQRLRESQWQNQHYRSINTSQIQSLRATISQYEAQLQNREQLLTESQERANYSQSQLHDIIRSRELEINELHLKINQFQVEFQRMQSDLKEMHNMVSHIQTLQAEITKMNKYITQQQEYYEDALAKTRSQVNASSSDRDGYEITVKKLEANIQALNIQINDLKIQYSSSQSQRIQLRSVRSELQLKLSSFQQTISTLQLQITNLHQTISVRQKEYVELNSRYEQHVSQMQLQLQNRSLAIHQLEQRLALTDEQFNALIRNSQFSIELIRSVLISIEAQLGQKESLHEAVHSQIVKGLEECQQWNEIGM